MPLRSRHILIRRPRLRRRATLLRGLDVALQSEISIASTLQLTLKLTKLNARPRNFRSLLFNLSRRSMHLPDDLDTPLCPKLPRLHITPSILACAAASSLFRAVEPLSVRLVHLSEGVEDDVDCHPSPSELGQRLQDTVEVAFASVQELLHWIEHSRRTHSLWRGRQIHRCWCRRFHSGLRVRRHRPRNTRRSRRVYRKWSHKVRVASTKTLG